MPTPPKPCVVLLSENKSHRTKAEIEKRKKGEEELATGKQLRERLEVKQNEIAHKEFMRVNKLLKHIGKNDALYEPIINRYCMLQAECQEFEEKRERIYKQMIRLEDAYDDFERDDDLKSYFKLQNDLDKNMVNVDKQVQAKRAMLLSIEKECVMTIAAALRSIPKKVVEEQDPLKGLSKYGG